MIQTLNARNKVVESARNVKDKGFQWTRRFIAITAVLAIIVLPKVAAIWAIERGTPWVISYGWTDFQPGFWFLTEGKEVLTWQSVKGLAITPLDTHLVSAIIGMYFGGSLVSHSR